MRTGMKLRSPRAEEEQIDGLLLTFDLTTDLIHYLDETAIRLDEDKLAIGV